MEDLTISNKGMFKVGTRFIGNVNGVEMEIVRMGNPSAKCRNEQMVQIKEINTGKISYYGLSALKHCNVTILN